MDKASLRRRLLSFLSVFEGKGKESEIIRETLLSLPLYRSAETILAFAPLSSEPDISPLLSDPRILLPFITGEGTMEFGKGKMKRNSLGFLEPEDRRREEYKEAIMLTPLLGADRLCHRIGRGKGFYDRYIEENGYRLFKIGLAFTVSIVDEIPVEDNDMALDMVITGDGSIFKRKGTDISTDAVDL